MPFDLVVFDLDGTLVDSAPDIAGALDAVLVERGLPTLGVTTVRTIIGDGVTSLVQRALALTVASRPPGIGPVDHDASDPVVAALVERFRELYASRVCDETLPYAGIVSLIDRLRLAGRSLGVLTNKPGWLARLLLAGLGLDERFATIVGDGDGFPRKPAPDALLAICSRQGVPPERTLVVGDGVPDLLMARAAGAPVAAVTWGYAPRALQEAHRPDWLVESPGDLLPIVLGG